MKNFKSHEIAHAWAHMLSPEGKSPGSMSFRGANFYSFATVIGRIVHPDKGEGRAYIIGDGNYSVTTSKHQSEMRRAIPPDYPIFLVRPASRGGGLSRSGSEIFEYSLERAAQYAAQAKRTRASAKKDRLEISAHRWQMQAQAVSNFYKLRRKVSPEKIARAAEKIARAEIAAKKSQAEAEKRRETERAEAVAAWIAGTGNYFPSGISRVLLRPGETREGVAGVETSRGVWIPADDARRAYAFALAKKSDGWHRNGERFPVGDFQLDAVNEFGIIAGCHRIAWADAEQFAARMGWQETNP